TGRAPAAEDRDQGGSRAPDSPSRRHGGQPLCRRRRSRRRCGARLLCRRAWDPQRRPRGAATPSRVANGRGAERGPGVDPAGPEHEKGGFAAEQLGRLSGCIQAGLDDVKEQQGVIRESVGVIAEVAATLEPGAEDITEREEKFEALI